MLEIWNLPHLDDWVQVRLLPVKLVPV